MRRKALRRAVAAMPLKAFSMPFPMTLNLSLIILVDLVRGQSIWVVNGDVMRAKREPLFVGRLKGLSELNKEFGAPGGNVIMLVLVVS
jgi:hypothetical protein